MWFKKKEDVVEAPRPLVKKLSEVLPGDETVEVKKDELYKVVRESVVSVLLENDTLEPAFNFHALFDEPSDEGGLLKLVPYISLALEFVLILLVWFRT